MIINKDFYTNLQTLETSLQLAKKLYYTENDFFVIKEQTTDKLIKISKDTDFLAQLVNFYPGY